MDLIEVDKSIAWVCQTYERDGVTEVDVVREGMGRDEIIELFGQGARRGLEYNRSALIRAIIWEAYREVERDGTERERGNVRSFWYERLMYTLLNVMGESGDDILDAIAKLGELHEKGFITTEEFEGKRQELLSRV